MKCDNLEKSLEEMPRPFDKAFVSALLHLGFLTLPMVKEIKFIKHVIFSTLLPLFQSDLEEIVMKASVPIADFVKALRLGFGIASFSDNDDSLDHM